MTESTRPKKSLREIAVFIASLDPASQTRMLKQLPDDQARAVQTAMRQLGGIAPEEKRRALEQFRTRAQASEAKKADPKHSAVRNGAHRPGNGLQPPIVHSEHPQDLLDLSSQAHAAVYSSAEFSSPKPDDANLSSADEVAAETMNPWQSLSPESLQSILLGERDIVVALVLSQIPEPNAKRLIRILPQAQAEQALAQLAELDHVDAEILRDVQAFLEQKIQDFTIAEQSKKANVERRDRLLSELAHATDRQQSQLEPPVNEINESMLNQEGETYSIPFPVHERRAQVAATKGRKTSGISEPLSVDDRAVDAAERPSNSNTVEASPDKPSMPFEELEKLSPDDFQTVLRSLPPQRVLLALYGMPKSTYAALRALVHPRDAKRLDEKLLELENVSLREIDAALASLCENAAKLLEEGRIGSLIPVSFVAAA